MSSISIEPLTYRVDVDWAPAHELVISLQAYLSRSDHKILELGSGWLSAVRRQLGPELASELSNRAALPESQALGLLIWRCPADRSVDGFLDWLGSASRGDLYELMGDELGERESGVLRQLAGVRDRWLEVLTRWNELYFSGIDGAILSGLAQDAEAKRALVPLLPARELVELATSGVDVAPDAGPELILLVPQYHYRPWNVYEQYRSVWLIHYPADALPTQPGEPPAAVVRVARALSDENRLRILQFLAGGRCSFTEVAHFTGLAKATVNHHMVMLRAAGLVRTHDLGRERTVYSLRTEALDDIGQQLRGYLKSKHAGG